MDSCINCRRHYTCLFYLNNKEGMLPCEVFSKITCKCGNDKCIGFALLHPVELNIIADIKERIRTEKGNVTFELKDSPSSGEIFTKFYELHVRKED